MCIDRRDIWFCKLERWGPSSSGHSRGHIEHSDSDNPIHKLLQVQAHYMSNYILHQRQSA